MAPQTAKKTDGGPGTKTTKDITYEQARDELLEVVNRLESGTESLAESMELFKRGEFLAGICERYLQAARTTIESASTSEDTSELSSV